MIGINKTTIAIIVLAYGAYHYTSTHDITPFPPTDDAVKTAIKQAQLSYANTDMEVAKDCRRTSGSVTEKSIFTCGIEYTQDGETMREDVRITKTKGKWKVVQ